MQQSLYIHVIKMVCKKCQICFFFFNKWWWCRQFGSKWLKPNNKDRCNKQYHRNRIKLYLHDVKNSVLKVTQIFYIIIFYIYFINWMVCKMSLNDNFSFFIFSRWRWWQLGSERLLSIYWDRRYVQSTQSRVSFTIFMISIKWCVKCQTHIIYHTIFIISIARCVKCSKSNILYFRFLFVDEDDDSLGPGGSYQTTKIGAMYSPIKVESHLPLSWYQ